jgi:hypothetical protein
VGRERKGESVKGTWARRGCGSVGDGISLSVLHVVVVGGMGREASCDAMR